MHPTTGSPPSSPGLESGLGEPEGLEIEVVAIPRANGGVTLVSAGTYRRLGLGRYRWRSRRVQPTSRTAYAAASIGGERRSLHRLILGLEEGDPLQGDHANGDGLDNRDENLRVADGCQNAANKRRCLTNKAGFKGVNWHHRGQCWQARIKHRGVRHHLGSFRDLHDAAFAFGVATVALNGPFARSDAIPPWAMPGPGRQAALRAQVEARLQPRFPGQTRRKAG